MKSFLFLIFLFISISAQAEKYDLVEGEGRFFSKKEDSLSFVKKQLLYQAYRDIYSKEYRKIGLDEKLFWKKYDEKFEDYFRPVLEKLKIRFGITEKYSGGNERYENALRKKRLVMKSKFGRLSRGVFSYSENKISRSTQMPDSRYINITAKVSRNTLNKIYYSFISERLSRNFERIFLDVSFNLQQANWSDLGVEVESDFTSVVKEHWRRWIKENFKDQISDVTVMTEELRPSLKKFMKLPQVVSTQIDEIDNGVDIASEFRNSLLLRVNIKMTKLLTDELASEVTFNFDGDFILLDLMEKKVLGSFDFGSSTHTYSKQDDHTLSSNMASFVYRIPLTELGALPKKLARIPDRNGVITFKIQNVGNINNFWDLKEFLTNKGAAFQFDTQIENYNGRECVVKLSYRGNKDDVFKKIKSFHGLKVNKAKLLKIPSLDDIHVLELASPEDFKKESKKYTKENSTKNIQSKINTTNKNNFLGV